MISSFPRKWSMRKIASSGNTERATRFSSRAEARSRPKGFSTMTRASSGEPRGADALDHGREERRRDREVVRRPVRRRASAFFSAANVSGFGVVAVDVARGAREGGRGRGRSSMPPSDCAMLSRACSRSCGRSQPE